MKTILVPTDFSAAAINATDYAADLCLAISGKLLLFNVYMLPVPLAEVPFVMTTGEEMQQNSEEALRKEAARIYEKTGVEIEWLARMGEAMDEIRELDKERNIDLLVMGSKKTEGLGKLIGSTTRSAINKLKKPVLIIPEKARYTKITAITYAADLQFQNNLDCFELLLELTRAFNAKLSVVHILKEGGALTAEQNAGKSRLESIFGNVEHSFHIMHAGDFEEGILQYIAENQADLLAVVAHQHHFLERLFGHHTSQELSQKTALPLLILQDKS